MYCPKCSTKAVPGQRYCRSCGANLGAIWDAMEGKRGQLDFETLKSDLKELGMNLRVGFEQAKENFKAQTNKLNQPNQTVQQNWRGAAAPQPSASQPSAPQPSASPMTAVAAATPTAAVPPEIAREMRKLLKDLRRMYNKVKLANTRKHSLQQGTLSILSGGAWLYAWKMILQAGAASGFLISLEKAFREASGVEVYGSWAAIQMLYLLGLIPVARGVAHLINGIFFAPKAEDLAAEPDASETLAPMFYYQPQPSAMPSAVETPSVISTNELERDTNSMPAAKQPSSVVEDDTKRFEGQTAKPA